MKIESKVLIYSMINNLLIAIIKVFGGVLFGLGSLFADGMHTFCDFITDIICIIGSKLSKKKPTKYHPFGFGKVEYLTNLFVGIILFLLGIFIIVSSFFKKELIPPMSVLFIAVTCFILKLIAIIVMYRVGTKKHSQLLITSVVESKADLYSTFGVIVIVLILQFADKYPILKYSDLLGSILIGVIVLKTAFKIILENSLSLIGEVSQDEILIEKVKENIDNKYVKNMDISLIEYGAYYKLQLTLELDPKLNLKQVSKIEEEIKKKIIRHRSLNIKYVTIYVTNKIK